MFTQTRNHNKHSSRRQKNRHYKKDAVTSNILPIFSLSCKESPHCLLHLTQTELKRCKHNSIYVSGFFKSHITSYGNVVFGGNVVAPLKKSTSHGKTIVWQELNLSETKGGGMSSLPLPPRI